MFPSIFNAPFLPQPKARENAFSKLYIIGIEKWTNELAEKKGKVENHHHGICCFFFLWWHISIKSMGEPLIDFP